MAQPVTEWVQEKTLGSGSFGSVILWRNKTTDQRIAVKQCRCPTESSQKSKIKNRWELEVQIMRKLTHPNVIRAVDVPDELNVALSEMPLLAMEYCSHGDLRKVLNMPENCCGLLETKIRTLLQNISSALQYLHSMRIVHRDLKPENIVLQEQDGKTLYKLIDLGYAKELDQGSLCTSFVGTVQYLAPELFLSQEYSSTVDFWSLGLVTHECVTGIRPFLPEMTPAQWMPIICKKKSNHICVFTKKDGTPCFSEKLFQENYLSRILIKNLEQWLRLMLEWDSQLRGIQFKEGVKEVIVFTRLNEILSKRVAQVFNVLDGSLNTYEIRDDMSLDDLYCQISNDTEIALEELEFLLPRGFPPDKNTLENWNQPDDDEWILFVYPKKFTPENFKVKHEKVILVEQMIQKISVMTPQEQLKAWSHSIYFVQKETIQHKRFLQAQQILTKHLLYRNSHLNKISSEVATKMKELQAVLRFFKESVNVDENCYNKQKVTGLSSVKLEHLFKVDGISKKISNLVILSTVS